MKRLINLANDLDRRGFYVEADLVDELIQKVSGQDDKIPGGKADKLDYSEFDPEELAMGIKVELEHTDDVEIAREIATDHLEEIPDYYTLLKKMEEEAGITDEAD